MATASLVFRFGMHTAELEFVMGAEVTAVGFEPTPLRTGALSQRLTPLGQTVLALGNDKCNYTALRPQPR